MLNFLTDYIALCIFYSVSPNHRITTMNAPPPPAWVVELNSTPPAKSKNANIADPPGFSSAKSLTAKQVCPTEGSAASADNLRQKSQLSTRKQPTELEMNTLKLKKAWEIALAPAKQIPMQAIMMYMSGNSLQIFSIMMVYML